VRFLRYPTEHIVRIILREFVDHRTDEQLMAELPTLIAFLTSLAERDKVERRTSGRDKFVAGKTEGSWPGEPRSTHEFRWEAVWEAKKQPNTSWKAAYQIASDTLKHTPYAGSPRTMKESYQRIQQNRRKRLQERDAKIRAALASGVRADAERAAKLQAALASAEKADMSRSDE
jgi:hypothetical protein